MFTIKHIDPRGMEFAVECVSYAVEPVADCPGDVRIMGFDDNHMSANHVGFWYGRRTGRTLGVNEIHIMNRFGATVASHYFDDYTPSQTEVLGQTVAGSENTPLTARASVPYTNGVPA